MATQLKNVEMLKPQPKPSGLDPQTEELRRVLLDRQELRARQAQSDRDLKEALLNWSRTRTGERGGIATEAGATFILRQAGLL